MSILGLVLSGGRYFTPLHAIAGPLYRFEIALAPMAKMTPFTARQSFNTTFERQIKQEVINRTRNEQENIARNYSLSSNSPPKSLRQGLIITETLTKR